MYNVLIVEDDPMVAMINEQYVSRNKNFCVVKSCRNGQQALDFLECKDCENGSELQNSNSKVDLIIMDVFMPYMDGIEALKKIREKKIDSEVIMVTAANDPSTLEEAMHLGIIDFLIKPFAYERFQVALEKFASKTEALRGANQTIDQNYVDNLISSRPSSPGSVIFSKPSETVIKANPYELPKGIQQKTLNLFLDYLEKQGSWVSGEKIAEEVGVSGVTVRHYMNYMIEAGLIKGEPNYGTGGRPSMLYCSLKS